MIRRALLEGHLAIAVHSTISNLEMEAVSRLVNPER
jgi:hypothetical protein